MKKLLLILALAGIFAACRNSAATKDEQVATEQKQSVQPQKVYYTNSQPATTQKKGWSKAAKGAVIGGASGAIVGGVVTKSGKGAVIGAVLGAGTGYVIGRKQDKKDGRVH